MLQQNHSSRTINVELKTELPYYLIGLPLMFLFVFIAKPDLLYSWPLALLITIAVLTYCLLTYRLNIIEIEISKRTVVLTDTNLLQMHRRQSYPLEKLQFTYKVGKASFRSREVNICKLFVNGKEVAVVTPDKDGWTDKSVNDLAKTLVGSGVSKKSTGYSLKDATINDL